MEENTKPDSTNSSIGLAQTLRESYPYNIVLIIKLLDSKGQHIISQTFKSLVSLSLFSFSLSFLSLSLFSLSLSLSLSFLSLSLSFLSLSLFSLSLSLFSLSLSLLSLSLYIFIFYSILFISFFNFVLICVCFLVVSLMGELL